MTYINKDEASSFTGRGPLAVYRERIASGDLKNDPDQARVVERLDQLWHELATMPPPAPPAKGAACWQALRAG
ncbi:ATPase [Acetobacter malorum]|uniref:ATPase n=1 Tax=Acetobacter malorum TaxID=178901 RepID=A0A177G7Z8_9PROT|nr:ATPase [Acetobacter malorum]